MLHYSRLYVHLNHQQITNMKAPNTVEIKKELKSMGIKVLRCSLYNNRMMLTFDESQIDTVYKYLVDRNIMLFTSHVTPTKMPRVIKLGYKNAAEFGHLVQC